jgi:O-antigen ligase
MIRQRLWAGTALALLLVWAPLPFASVQLPFFSLLFAGVLAALALGILTAAPDDAGTPSRTGPAFAIAVASIAGIALLGLLQSVAWPSALVSTVVPGIATLSRQSAALLDPGAAPDSIALSLAPRASRGAALAWLLAAAAALAAWLAGRSRRGRRLLLAGLIAGAALQVAIAVQLWLKGSESLWGVTLTHIPDRLRGSFINPNHLALFLEIALAAVFAWLWWSLRRALRDSERAESRLLAIAPAALLFLLLFGGLVLTGSRAGVLSAVAALAVQGFLIGRRRGRAWLAGVGLAAALAAVVLFSLFGVEGSLQRLLVTPIDDVGGNVRFRAAAATLELWSRFPVTGVGLGAFRAAFPLVQPEGVAGLWRHAHSDWIELLATTGVVGTALFAVAIWFGGRRIAEVVSRGERSEDRAAGLAATGAAVAVALHSFADFGVTLPANAFALAVVLGGAAAAATERRGERGGGS